MPPTLKAMGVVSVLGRGVSACAAFSGSAHPAAPPAGGLRRLLRRLARPQSPEREQHDGSSKQQICAHSQQHASRSATHVAPTFLHPPELSGDFAIVKIAMDVGGL
jgi:hypothetical protein